MVYVIFNYKNTAVYERLRITNVAAVSLPKFNATLSACKSGYSLSASWILNLPHMESITSQQSLNEYTNLRMAKIMVIATLY